MIICLSLFQFIATKRMLQMTNDILDQSPFRGGAILPHALPKPGQNHIFVSITDNQLVS